MRVCGLLRWRRLVVEVMVVREVGHGQDFYELTPNLVQFLLLGLDHRVPESNQVFGQFLSCLKKLGLGQF